MKESRDHSDELQDAPHLRKLRKKEPFQVPDAYFEELSNKLARQVAGEASEEEPEGDILQRMDKTNVFKTPDAYFEGILGKFEKRRDSDEEKSKTPRRIIPFGYIISVAAAIFLLLFIFFKPDTPGNPPRNEFAELEALPLEDLIAEVAPEQLSEDMILSGLSGKEWEIVEEEISDDWELEEGEKENMDELIDDMDIYLLEDELDKLEGIEILN